jgi:hypothetical protein
MTGMTRRTLMRGGGVAASATILSPAVLAAEAGARLTGSEAEPGNVFHVFAFIWKPEAKQADMDRAARDIAAFQGKIPGLLETHVGENLSPRGKGYTFGGVMRFKDQAALDAYVEHPSHQALLKWLRPLIDAVELDLKA